MEKKECTKCNKNLDITNFYRDYTIFTKTSYLSKCKNCCAKQTKERKKHDKNENITTKVCNNAGGCGGGLKPISEFYKSTRHKDGYFSFCCECHKSKTKNIGNNPQIKRTPEYMKIYNKKRYGTPENKIKYSIRKSLLTYIKKDNKTIKYLGCSTNFFRFWIGKQFIDNMNWDNHGELWHFDHVNPCSNFDLTKEIDIFKCYNWSNFRPCNKTENILKSNTVDMNLINNHTILKNNFLETYKNNINITGQDPYHYDLK